MLRRLIFWILMISIVGVFAANWDEILAVFLTLLWSKWQWVLVAVLLQFGVTMMDTLGFKVSFRVVDIQFGFWDLLPVLLGALVVDAVAPGGAPAGTALVIDDLSRRSHAGARVTAGTILQLIADFSTLSLILLGGLIYLWVTGIVELEYLLSAGASFLIAAGLMVSLLLGVRKPDWLRRIFGWMQRAVNQIGAWFKHPELLEQNWAEKSTSEYLAATRQIFQRPAWFFLVMAIMAGEHLLSIACLAALFLAFNQQIALGTLVVGYTVSILVAITSPAPNYMGLVEGSMALVFVSLHAPWQAAVAVALSYRGLSFWLPLIAGVFLLRQVKTFQSSTKSKQENPIE
jgi:uncharacterized protein (TIRG00374 family)